MASALDEDAARTVASGRETVGAMLSSAQSDLKKVFLVFLVGMLAAFFALRYYVWDALKQDILYSQMAPAIRESTQVVAVTPFDVILLQVKVGMITGVLFAIPALVWVSRAALKERGIWPSDAIPRWKLGLVGLFTVALFVGGVSYAYELFFPIMFNFLASNAVNAGFSPTYSIVMWTEFVFFLTLSFGLAAQLPLAMSGLSLTGVIPYETFRDKWRYAVLGIFAFGAMFSPPDPFTQIMWAVPLVALYVFSLGVTRLAVLSTRAGAEVPIRQVVRKRWNILAGVTLLAGAGVYGFLTRGGLTALNDGMDAVGSSYAFPTAGELGRFGLGPEETAILYAVVVALVAAAVALFYLRIRELEAVAAGQQTVSEPTAAPTDQSEVTAPSHSASAGRPAEIDIGALSATAVHAAPREAFEALSEEEALDLARDAIAEEDGDKAEAILDRFEEINDPDEDEEDDGDDADPVTSTAAGMANAFTEDETTEDDIGGYYYDIAFILDSLTSKVIWIVGTFMAVLAATFLFLYQGGIGTIRDSFLRSMPEALADQVNIVTLHPVEALIFEIKFSTLLAALSVLPIILYFAWPAIQERGFSTGASRNILLVWGGSLVVALVGGTLLGFFYIAPGMIGWLAGDALTSNMVIAYRINNFGWLVIFTTVGIGVLAMIPVTMWLFVRGNIVSYRTLRTRWRVFVIGVFAIAGFATPKGVFTMFIVAIPAAVAYGIGLGPLAVFDRLRN
ncbi:twin-arginine translocase subunit TatC [Salinibaculum rarum]|uniref:twin-arginine translocase subunit TatC n=1 Tax=Salinibaculum rarum TaxID=3058903 RepID=UPI00265EC462|nr:twin-arginine translocase subunit TatC [Salinibaculum sp. KK48]